MDERLCLLTVHAHPDDESSKGAATVARYAADGVRTVLVCCTGGEAGDILNPALDRPEVRDDLHAVRMAELAAATDIIGFHEVVMLGYRDSGMPDTEANAHPECFANADEDEAVGRLVEVIRRERPQVVITYPDDQGGYQHPDHLRVHDISVVAFTKAADPTWHPELGPVWEPSKLYYSMWSRARIEARHRVFLERGLESPYDDRWFERPSQDHLVTTQVPIDGFAHVRREALLAHATQIDPTSTFWFGLPPEVEDAIHPFDDYRLAVGELVGEPPERDLFAGLRQPAVR